MPEVKFTYEVTLGNLIVALGAFIGFCVSAYLFLSKVLPPFNAAMNFVMVSMAEHRLLVADYAERHGIDVPQVGDLAMAEMAIHNAKRKAHR